MKGYLVEANDALSPHVVHLTPFDTKPTKKFSDSRKKLTLNIVHLFQYDNPIQIKLDVQRDFAGFQGA